jgi:hypothetical protein
VENGEYALGPKTGSIMDMRGCIPRLDHVQTIEERDQAILDHASALDAATRSDAGETLPDREAA